MNNEVEIAGLQNTETRKGYIPLYSDKHNAHDVTLMVFSPLPSVNSLNSLEQRLPSGFTLLHYTWHSILIRKELEINPVWGEGWAVQPQPDLHGFVSWRTD